MSLKLITCKDHDLPKLRSMNIPDNGPTQEDVESVKGFRPITQAEEIERDILEELSTLRQKVADLETAKAFQVSIKDNHSMRLNDVEDKLRIMERILGGLELQRLRGNG